MKKTLWLPIPIPCLPASRKSLLSFIFPSARTILLFVFFVSFRFAAFSQTLGWAKSIGGVGADYGQSIVVDASGNVYTTGYFIDTVDFDPGAGTFNLTSAGSNDIFILKLDVAGNFVWAKAMGGTGVDAGKSIVDASGNVFTTGLFSGTADFDPGAGSFNLTSAGNYDIFISKLDASGNFVWAKAMGGTGYDFGQSIAIDASANIYTIGYFPGTADFDPGAGSFNLTSAGNTDIFISKLDASGNFVWAKAMGGVGADFGQSIAIDASDNIYSTGYFPGTADFDPGAGSFNLTSAGNTDIFISKLDSSGNFIWAKAMGGTFNDCGQSIAVDASDNIYTTGYFNGTADFDPGAGSFNLISVGGDDIFISKLDVLGNFVWAKSMGGTAGDRGQSIAVDASANIYTTGLFIGTADFDPGAGLINLTSAGGSDIFISKLDVSGNFVWGKSMGGIGDDFGQSIAVDASGNVYTTGCFWGTVDFDPGAGIFNLTSNGAYDIFVHKMCSSSPPVTPGTISGTTTICSGSSNTYSITAVSGATSYTWILPGGWTGTSTTDSILTTASSTSGNVSVTANNACGSSSAQILSVIVNSIPATPGALSGAITICSGSSNTYSITAIGGATSYNWTLPGGWTGTSTTNSITTTANATSGNITVSATNICGTSAASSQTITVNTIPPATPGAISGATTICSGSSNTYSITAVGGATSYNWTLPGGWTGTSTTNSITTTASGTGGIITVSATNACGTSAASSQAITVNTIPATPGAISGVTSICSGSSNTYSVTAIGGATSYTWILPGGWTGTSTTDSILTTASSTSGNISVTANNGCGSSSAQILSVIVNSIPPTPGTISGAITICSGSSNTYSITTVGGATSYNWTLPGGWTGTSTTNSISATASATSGNVTVTANNGCGSSAAQTLSVTVNASPTVNLGSDIVQANPPAVLDAGAGFTTYLWSTTESTQTISVSTNGAYIVTITNIWGCSDSDTIQVNFTSGIVNTDGTPAIISLYPNPTSNGVFSVSIQNIETSNLMLEILDMNGRVILNKYIGPVSGNIIEAFSLTDLRVGTYVMRITANGKSTQLSFVISE